jgi:small subunit ribosomal protein S16
VGYVINIRLQRRGRKNDPSFRVVVVDSKKKPKTGNYLEMVGSYDPRADRVEIKGDRVLHWLKNGAQASDTVHNLLVSQKIIDAKKINVLPKKTVAAKEVVAEPEAPASLPTSEGVGTPTESVGAAEEVAQTEDNSVAQEAPAA